MMNDRYLAHHGILGMKWGVRRYQNPDGSLTPAGKIRYYNSYEMLNDRGKKQHLKSDSNLSNALRDENYKKALKELDILRAFHGGDNSRMLDLFNLRLNDDYMTLRFHLEEAASDLSSEDTQSYLNMIKEYNRKIGDNYNKINFLLTAYGDEKLYSEHIQNIRDSKDSRRYIFKLERAIDAYNLAKERGNVKDQEKAQETAKKLVEEEAEREEKEYWQYELEQEREEDELKKRG